MIAGLAILTRDIAHYAERLILCPHEFLIEFTDAGFWKTVHYQHPVGNSPLGKNTLVDPFFKPVTNHGFIKRSELISLGHHQSRRSFAPCRIGNCLLYTSDAADE